MPTTPSSGGHRCSTSSRCYNDELTELLLSEETGAGEALIHKTLREATLHSLIVPVLCGSALDGIGVQPVLDAVAAYLPSPADMPPVEGANPKKKDAKLLRKPTAERAVLPAWCSRSRPTGTATCATSASTPAG